MKTIFILCGKPGSGKSTLANYLREKYDFIHFSADDFMLKLFGEIEDRETFDKKLNLCKEIIYSICDQILQHCNVVLDFGFWTKRERDFIKKRFENYNVVLVYLKLSDDVILDRISYRNEHLKDNEYFMTKETYKVLSNKFEEPIECEDVLIYESTDKFVRSIQKYIK